MGNNKFKLTKLALALGLTATLSGCFSDNDDNDYVKPPEPPAPTVKAPVADTPAALTFYVAGNVVDSETGEVVASTVKFLEAGEASANVVALNGDAITEVVTTDGSFTFNLVEGAELTQLTALVTAEGYASNSVVVDLSDKSEVVDTIVSLVKLDETKVAVKKATATAAEGKLADDLSVTADADAGGATVTIKKDIELQDADGVAVTGTDVTLSVVTADLNAAAGKTSVISLIPEGFNSADATEVAIPAAYMNVEMLAGDTKVKKFSDKISLTAKLPAGSAAVGDKFDVSSYNEDSGVWSAEAEQATVAAGTAGALTLPATFDVDHLTGFLLSKKKPVCSTPISYTFTGDQVPAAGLYVNLTSSTVSKKKLVKKNQGNLYGAAAVAKNGFAADATVDVSVKDKNGNEWGTVANANLCGAITVDLDSPVTIVAQNLNVTYTCSNAQVDQDKAFPLTGAVVLYSQAKRTISTAVETAGSYALTGLESGADYAVKVIPTGINVGLQSTTVTASGTDSVFNIVRDNCTVEDRVVTGTGTGTTGGS